MENMNKAIRAMKNNKCRDPDGLTNQLLKPEMAGFDFKLSLLSLLNKLKETLEIPQMMKYVKIVLIPKSGSTEASS